MRDGVIDNETNEMHVGSADNQWEFDKRCANFVVGKVVRKTIK